jgi:N-acetylglucosamine-6-phosphate deacetylase
VTEARIPSDLHDLATEQVRRDLRDLDLLSIDELVALMCSDARRVPDAVIAAEAAIARAVAGIAERLRHGGRLIYVGAGTAGRLGMLDAAEAGPTFDVAQGQVTAVLAGGTGAFDVAVENAEDDREGGAAAIDALVVDERDAVVGIAASGRTPFVLGAVAAARAAGSLTIGLACNAGTPLAAAAELPIEVVVGSEILAGSTRLNAGTAQKIVLNVLSTASMVQLGKTYGGLMIDLRATNAKLRVRAARIVAEIAQVSLDEAEAALERADWRAKPAAAALLGNVEPGEAEALLARHGGRLRDALEELGPKKSGEFAIGTSTKRLGVAAAYVDGTFVPGDVAVDGDEIVELGLAGSGAGLAVPALVDAQVNGYAGIDILAADEGALVELCRALARDGVGAFLPTLITSDEHTLLDALERVARVAERRSGGAAIAGVHLEGPFLSPERAGAHPREHLRLPDTALLERLLAAGPVRMVTIAPELPGALELIRACVERGVVASLGHSATGAAEAHLAFAAGASAVTHLFNAMPPLTAREPGLAGAALATPGVAVQLIADGVHVGDDAIRLAFAAAAGRCSLVSDAISAAGRGDGSFRLGEVHVEVRDGVARRADGTLAGSTASLASGLAYLAGLGVEPAQAVAAVADRPRRLLGLGGDRGLQRGTRGPILVLDDALRFQRVVGAR